MNLPIVDLPGGDRHRAFGRAVEIEHSTVELASGVLGFFRRHDVAAGDQGPDAAQLLQMVGYHRLKERRGEKDVGDPAMTNESAELGQGRQTGWIDHQSSAVE